MRSSWWRRVLCLPTADRLASLRSRTLSSRLTLEALENRRVLTTLLQFSQATYLVSELQSLATIQVNRVDDAQGVAGPVSVNFTTIDGTAIGGQDYTPTTGTLTFAPGQTSQTFTISILFDTLNEGDETVNLRLSNPTNGAILGTTNAAVLTIQSVPPSNVTITPVPVFVPQGIQFGYREIAHFSDTVPGLPGSYYQATISWGDGTPVDIGSVIFHGPNFVVSGSHNYATEGVFNITVTVTPLLGPTAVANNLPVTSGGFVSALFREVLEREPDQAGLSFWSGQLLNGLPRDLVAQSFWESTEHRVLEVQQLYQTFYDRAADALGLRFWVGQLQMGMSEADVAVKLTLSPEFTARFPTTQATVGAYFRLILGREGTASDLSYWEQILTGGARTRSEVVYLFLSSPEAYVKAVNDYFMAFLERQADAAGAQSWLAYLESGEATPGSITALFLGSPEYLQRSRDAAYHAVS